ncbi:MAG: stage V sporulation protein E [Defluviitaleaceae bacterium]|nr:stage V sporulation protein E [Defluviitaleaceae bacterium]
MSQKQPPIDLLILILTATLTIIGLVFVLSASFVWATHRFNDPFYFFKRQLLFANIGFIGMIVVSKINYTLYKKHATAFLIASFIMLVLVLIPGIGMVRGGARSWIGIGAFSLQPSEFMKLALIIFLAKFMANNPDEAKTFKRGVLPLMSVILLVFGIIMLQPDFGSGMVITAASVLMLFLCGVPFKYFLYFIGAGILGIAALIVSAPYRLARITSYLDPLADPQGSGFQILQSLYAITPGGLLGHGIGNSIQKHFYLPEPQTDFIFAIIAEEIGFIGANFILLLFICFFLRLGHIALKINDLFAKYVVLGIMSVLCIQVMINVGVVIGLLPVTGITLPFMSYGGSSLTITLLSIGVILNISRHTESNVV